MTEATGLVPTSYRALIYRPWLVPTSYVTLALGGFWLLPGPYHLWWGHAGAAVIAGWDKPLCPRHGTRGHAGSRRSQKLR